MDKKILNKEFKNKKILITGGSGLIGKGLLNYFLNIAKNDGIKLYLYSISKSKNKIKIKDARNIKINYMYFDLAENLLNDLPKFDFIFHCAGYGQPKKFMSKPINTFRINTEVTIRLLKKLKKNGKFIFMSTSELYSGLRKTYPNENDIGLTNTNHPRSSYIESKRCGEAIINSISTDSHNYKSIRLSLVYGPGTKIIDNRVINEFIISAIKNKKIRMLDKGLDLRHYIFLSDAIEMIINICVYGKYKIYNIGGKEKISIAQLGEKICKFTNAKLIKPDLKRSNKLIGTPSKVGVSIKRYEKEFGKMDFKSLDFGIKKTINWYKILLKDEK